MPADQAGHGKSGKEKKGKPDRSLRLLAPLSDLWSSLADLQAGVPLGLVVRGKEFYLLVRDQVISGEVGVIPTYGDWPEVLTRVSQVTVVATFAGRPVDGLAFPVQELSVYAC